MDTILMRISDFLKEKITCEQRDPKNGYGGDSPSFFFFHNGIVFICDKCITVQGTKL
jgi:hypothetical protein